MDTLEAPEKMALTSMSITDEQRAKLKSLFPEVFTEGNKIDFDKLKLSLGEMVDTGKERYGMTWPGKAECFQTIQKPSVATLLPVREESVNFDETENLIIEGDNLEVLKLLQKAYLGKVKMIYIDPPYNTGNDFIYPDNYSESLATYLQYTGQVDAEGRKFSSNTEADGRFHSKWLNMMYPRLFLAKNLLREDGVIVVSMGDNEIASLRLILNEVFGEENFIAHIVWQKKYVSNMETPHLLEMHDHLLVFGREKELVKAKVLPRDDDTLQDYKNPDKDPRGPWRAQDLSTKGPYGPGLFTIAGPKGDKFDPPPGRFWRCDPKKYAEWLADGRITFGKSGNGRPMLKSFLSEATEGNAASTWWDHKFAGHNKEATLEIKELFDGTSPFDTPKPVRLLKRLISILATEDSLVLDFFAGSGTTAQAVLELNTEDGGNRKFAIVQLPEPTTRAGYSNIADITKDRVRRAASKINQREVNKLALTRVTEHGFKVFKLASSNLSTWNSESTKDVNALNKQLELHVNHVLDGRRAEDLLFEILLKSGFALTTSIEEFEFAGKRVYKVADGSMLVCLERELTPEVIKAMADMRPPRVVCLDAGFAGNDQLKSNAVQIMKSKGVTSFKTV